jgi:hypothetical protein
MIDDKTLLEEVADYLEDQLAEAPECDRQWFMDAIAAVARVVDQQ